VQQVCQAHERSDGEILPAALDALKILHRKVARFGELFLRHAARRPQLGDTTPKIAQHIPSQYARHPMACRRAG